MNVSLHQKLRLEVYTVTGTESEQFYDRGSTVWGGGGELLRLTIHRKHTHACAFSS